LAKQSITVELSDETIRCLAQLGAPRDVLAELADSVAQRVCHRDHQQRVQTDRSLRCERDHSDVVIAKEREGAEEAADEVVRLARQRADELVRAARGNVDREHPEASSRADPSSGRDRARADDLLEDERSSADTALEKQRTDQRLQSNVSLAGQRQATDRDLSGERSHADSLGIDQREANEQMVSATIRAQELAEEAHAATERAEETQRELRSVADFREMFIGVLGHDLRNPLGSIVMAAALLLRRKNLDEQDAQTATRIIRSSQRMTRMITQLLDLTRARLGGGLVIEPKPIDLREVCRNVVDEFEVTIQLDLEGDLTGTWDEDRLAEVLSNLAGNAVEYAAPATSVSIRAYRDAAEVVVEISNQGDPIPADVLPFIFEPFRRAKGRAKSPNGNLGLGLYIAQQVVFSHGGTLDVHSADGTTTFVTRLPRVPPDHPGEAP